MRSLKLGSMLPEKFYPIIGEITLTDIETDQVMFSGDCEIPRYDAVKQNDYIFINGKIYNFIDNNKEYSNTITIKANDIPIKYKYQINTTVEDGDFNNMCITGMCRCESNFEISLNCDMSSFSAKLIPLIETDDDNNDIKLCDINVWKE